MKRRTLIKALPFLGFGVAVPLAARDVTAEEPNVRVRRLQRELSDALAELMKAPVASADFVSVVYPSGTTKDARTLYDRDLFEANEARELVRACAIYEWRAKDEVPQAAMTAAPFNRTQWEFAQLDENEARNAMLRTFRGEPDAA